MPRSVPYQPLLLRILHGLSGILVIAAIITGFLGPAKWSSRFRTWLTSLQTNFGAEMNLVTFILLLLPPFFLIHIRR